MDKLTSLKKKLKQWESGFLKSHNRKPGKSDIDAVTDIRDAYLQYNELRKTTSPAANVGDGKLRSSQTTSPSNSRDTNGNSESNVTGEEMTSLGDGGIDSTDSVKVGNGGVETGTSDEVNLSGRPFDNKPNPGSSGEFDNKPKPGSSNEFNNKPKPGSSGKFDNKPKQGPSAEFDNKPKPGSSGEFDNKLKPGPSGELDKPKSGPSGELDKPKPGSSSEFDKPKPGPSGELNKPKPGSSSKVEVWGRQFDKKLKEAPSSSGNTGKVKEDCSLFVKNLRQKMFQQSLKMAESQSSDSQPCVWRKPDTPRPAHVQSRCSPTVPSHVGMREAKMLSYEEDDANEVGIAANDSARDIPPNEGTDKPPVLSTLPSSECSDKLPVFGKMFERALSMTKQKNKFTSQPDTADVFTNKFQTVAKPKKSVLPTSLSKLVSEHKEKHKDEFDWGNGQDAETVGGDIGDFSDTEQTGGDIEDEVDGNVGKHAWDVPVRNLVIDDMKEQIKRKRRIDGKENSVKGVATSERKVENSRNKRKMPAQVGVASSSGLNVRMDQNCESIMKENDEAADTGSVDPFNFIDGDLENTEDEIVIKIPKMLDLEEEETVKKPEKPKVNKTGRSLRGKNKAVLRKKPNDDSVFEDMDVEAELGNHDGSGKEEEDEIKVAKKRKSSVKAVDATKKKKTSVGDIARIDDDGNIIKPKAMKRPVTRTKAPSNENFVRLNMKVKTYKRKGRCMSGPQYKRKMWKEKMQARSKSYGDSCFKCGQDGHWANKCPGNKADQNQNIEAVMDEDFPSMQEAAMLARGIRNPRQALQTVTNSTNTVSECASPSTSAASCPTFTSTDSSPAASDSTLTAGNPVPAMVEDEELEIQSEIMRSSHRESVVTPPTVEPLIVCDEDGNVPAMPQFVRKGLQKFGYDGFRPGQEEAVMRILCGLSTLVVLSTGGGKSLCYQLPAYLYAQRSPCVTLVISPLVSLMEDQVRGLPPGVRGVCYHTNMSANQRQAALGAVKDGRAHFLLVSPEAITGAGAMMMMSSLPSVAFVCIDEAHCLSEWSHNFRPSYLRLSKVLQQRLGIQCFLGLTATATMSTAADVSRHLNISDFERATVRGSPIPDNLCLSVSRDDDREQALLGLLQGDRFSELDSIIIYCTRRDQTDKVATVIRTYLNKGAPLQPVARKSKKKGPRLEWDAESYHAGLSAAQRKRVQNAFMSGNLRVVVATVAFGMGLDKADVRGIIHYNMPKSFESYVQEIGRAGRDGKPAQCHVFLDPEGKDLCELRRHTYANTVDYRTLKKLVQKVFPHCRCRDVHNRHTAAVQEANELPANDDGRSEVKDKTENTGIKLDANIGAVVPGNNQEAELLEDSNSADLIKHLDDFESVGNLKQTIHHDEATSQSEPSDIERDSGQTKYASGSDRSCSSKLLDNAEVKHPSDIDDIIDTKHSGDMEEGSKFLDNAEVKHPSDIDDSIDTKHSGDMEEGSKLLDNVEVKHPSDIDDTIDTKHSIDTEEGQAATSAGRLCPGHERALPIDKTVMDLDVKEEGISTLLCYLELHSNRWMENMTHVYATCKIQCYGGPSQLQTVAKKCPPVGVAIAKARKDGRSFERSNQIEFPVVAISDMMGWDSGPVKKELKMLQWNLGPGSGPSRTGVLVEFSDLAYHFRSPGDFTDDELDDILQYLHMRVQRQEKSELRNLSHLYKSLKSASHKNYWMCADSLDMEKNDKLKAILNEYFDNQSSTEDTDASQSPAIAEPAPDFSMDQVRNDIRQFYNIYGQEHSISGRVIARIFHGIGSPCYPATTWGRVRRFWRCHLEVDFNELVRITTKELISMR